MKVALLTDADVFAGTERHLLDLARALQDADSECQPIIFCPAPSPLSERAQQFGIATVAVPANRGKLFDAKLLRTLRRNLRSARVDIIHAHNGRTLLHAVLAQRLAQRGCVVFTQHFLEPAHASHGGLKAKVFTAAHRWVNSHVKHFLAVSNAAREGMVERGNATGEKVAVVHHALYNPDQSTLAPQEQVRAKFGVPVNAPLVVAVARLEKEKSIDTLVDAMAILCARYPQAVCILAGEGAERSALEAQVARHGLQANVLFAGFYSDALSLINAADLFVLPSSVESFGLVLLEAMALGKPVVATQVGGPAEVVQDGATGFLVPPRDANALADAIEKVLSDRSLAGQFGQAGRARYEQHFQPQRMAEETLAVYRAALCKGGAA